MAARRIALSFPEAVAMDHHGRPSFRVRGKIFATLWDAGHLNVLVPLPLIRAATRREPRMFHEFWWGQQLRAVSVELRAARVAPLRDLMREAWAAKAPRALREAHLGE